MHEDALTVDSQLAKKLVEHQFPQYANLTVDALSATGSTNMLFRLGNDMLIRMPRQPGAGEG